MGEGHFNTTGESGRKLRSLEQLGKSQEQAVLEFFEHNPDSEYTAEDIGHSVLPRAPRTSWGRCLSTLKASGKLQKTDKQREGAWGRMIYTWRLARDDSPQLRLI